MTEPFNVAAVPQNNLETFHDPEKLFKVLQEVAALNNITTPENENTKYTFQNIDNLVFQGGGVKGVAYLGVVEELELNHNHVLEEVKRVAGTSAGSMVALYISLGMNANSIRELLVKPFSEYLDADIEIPVKKIPGYDKPVNYKVSHILGRFLEIMGDAYRNAQSWTQFLRADSQITALVLDGLEYHELLNGIGGFKGFALRWLPTSVLSLALPTSSLKKKLKELETLLKEVELNCHKYAQRKGIPALEGKVLHYAIAELLGQTFFKEAPEHFKTVGRFNMTVDDCCMFSGTRIKEQLIYSPIRRQIKEKVKYYRKDPEPAPSQQINPLANIQDTSSDPNLKKFDRMSPPFNIEKATFGDLERCLQADGKTKCFKSLYVTAFNTRTLQTEVFSAEHSPNVVVADAIRASMGIPVFFSSTTIRDNGKVRKSRLKEKPGENVGDEAKENLEKIRYFDGGVFDNYALWIFDDLKYYSDEWAGLNTRFHIENPKTLGFKLYDKEFEKKLQKKNDDKLEDKISTSTGLAGFLLGATLSYEENVFDRGNHEKRTVFVDNRGISTFAFQALPKDQDNLIEAGREAIQEYFIKRSEANGESVN